MLNIIILVLYRTGYRGGFLGVGGTWNLNEEKNPDAEIVASGVFVGFFIYTVVILISYGFGSNHQKKTLVVSAHIIIYIYILHINCRKNDELFALYRLSMMTNLLTSPFPFPQKYRLKISHRLLQTNLLFKF